jgi:hypothetical protein
MKKNHLNKKRKFFRLVLLLSLFTTISVHAKRLKSQNHDPEKSFYNYFSYASCYPVAIDKPHGNDPLKYLGKGESNNKEEAKWLAQQDVDGKYICGGGLATVKVEKILTYESNNFCLAGCLDSQGQYMTEQRQGAWGRNATEAEYNALSATADMYICGNGITVDCSMSIEEWQSIEKTDYQVKNQTDDKFNRESPDKIPIKNNNDNSYARKPYNAHEFATSDVPGFAGCSEAKDKAEEAALNLCFLDGNEHCKLIKSREYSSKIATIEIVFIYPLGINSGSCSFEATAVRE